MTIVTKTCRRLHAESRTEQQNLTAQYALRVIWLLNARDWIMKLKLQKHLKDRWNAWSRCTAISLSTAVSFLSQKRIFTMRAAVNLGDALRICFTMASTTRMAYITGGSYTTNWDYMGELTVNFMLCSQSSVPVQPHQEEQGFTIRTNTFRNIIMHVQFLVNKEIIPKLTPVKVKSLSQLGAKVLKQGLPLRPKTSTTR